MNYLLPSSIVRSSLPKDGQTIYHHHKIEIIQLPKKEMLPKEETLKDRIKEAASYALIIVGALFALAAASAIVLQSIGYICGAEVRTLLMPSIAAMLMGFNISKGELKTAAKVSIPSGIPGVTISAS